MVVLTCIIGDLFEGILKFADITASSICILVQEYGQLLQVVVGVLTVQEVVPELRILAVFLILLALFLGSLRPF